MPNGKQLLGFRFPGLLMPVLAPGNRAAFDAIPRYSRHARHRVRPERGTTWNNPQSGHSRTRAGAISVSPGAAASKPDA